MVSSDDGVRISLGYEVDDASIRAAQDALKRINDSLKEVSDAASNDEGINASRVHELVAAYDQLQSSVNGLNKESPFKSIGEGAKDLFNEVGRAGNELERFISITDNQTGFKSLEANLKKALETYDQLKKSAAQPISTSAIEKSVQNTASATEQLQMRLAQLDRLNTIDEIAEEFYEAARAGKSLEGMLDNAIQRLEELGASSSEIDRVAKAFDRASRGNIDPNERFDLVSRNVGLAGDFQSNLGALQGLTGFTGSLGGVGTGLSMLGEFVVLAEELPRLKESVSGLPGVVNNAAKALGTSTTGLLGSMVLATGAVIAVDLAFQQFNKNLDANREHLNAALSAQDAYYQALSEMTSEEVEKIIAERRKGQDALLLQIEELERVVDSAWAQEASGIFGELGRAARDAVGWSPSEQLREKLTALKTEFDENEMAVARLTQGLHIGAFAANDAARAEEELAKARVDAVTKAVQDSKAQYLEQARLQEMGSEQLRSELKRLEDEMAANAIAMDKLRESGLAGEGALTLLDALSTEYYHYQDLVEMINNSLLESAEVREREEEAMKKAQAALDALFKAQQDRMAQVEKVTKAEEALAKATAERDAIRPRIEAELAEKEEKIRTDATEKRLKIEEKYQKDVQEADKKNADTRLKIQRQYERSYNQAVGDRDALAAQKAQQKRDDDLRELEANVKEEQRKRRDSYRQQLRDLTQSETKQLEVARASAERQIQMEVAKANAQIQLRQQQFNAEQQALMQLIQYANMLQQTANALRIPNSTAPIVPQVVTGSSQAVELAIADGWKYSLDYYENIVKAGRPIAGGGGGGGSGGYYPTRDGGGDIQAGRTYNINNELITFDNPGHAWGVDVTRQVMGLLNKAQTPSIGAFSPVFAPNVTGLSRREVQRELKKQMDVWERDFLNDVFGADMGD